MLISSRSLAELTDEALPWEADQSVDPSVAPAPTTSVPKKPAKTVQLPGTIVISPGKKPTLVKASKVSVSSKTPAAVTTGSSSVDGGIMQVLSEKWPWIVGGLAAVGALIWLLKIPVRKRKQRPLG